MGCKIADFPDTVVWFLPFLHHGLDHVFHHLPHFFDFVQGAGEVEVILVDDIHQVAQGVVLFLPVGVISDAHRFGPFKAAQVG